VVLSGAGLSTDSGIQDFRGPGGIWTLNPTAQKKSTYQAFITDPELRGSYWRSRYEHPVWQAEPNAGHLAVAGLTSSELETTVVTQNTDGLHQRAGTPADQVVELHGTMHEVLCVDCGHRSATTEVLARIEAGEAVPDCSRCGGIIKTASTMFGQTMAPAVFARAERAVISCDLVLAVGTTLTVEPAGSLAASAVHAGATLVIVNWDPTPYDGIATELIRDPLGEALPRIAAQLLAGTTRTRPRAAADEVASAAVTAILCDVNGPLPGAPDESLVAAVVSPTFLMNLFMDTTPAQERRALTVLARAAVTRPALRDCLAELLSVLPGVSPAAVDAAVHGGYPEPLADALTSLASNAALPADLLEAIPAGTTVLGEFPVLLAQSLVEAYERRADVYPATALPGLATMLIELAERLADMDRAVEAKAAADRAVAVAARLAVVQGTTPS
jgi:NAD-dependent deacetylase